MKALFSILIACLISCGGLDDANELQRKIDSGDWVLVRTDWHDACIQTIAENQELQGSLSKWDRVLGKAIQCISASYYSYLLDFQGNEECVQCIDQMTCHQIIFEHECRPACLKE